MHSHPALPLAQDWMEETHGFRLTGHSVCTAGSHAPVRSLAQGPRAVTTSGPKCLFITAADALDS